MKAICDAGNVAINLFELRKKKSLTFPPLPMSFEGSVDLIPFILYESLIMDGNSIEYLLQDKLLNDRTKALVKGLLYDKIIEEMNYVEYLKPYRDQIQLEAFRDYEHMLEDIKVNSNISLYYKSKMDWLEFASRIGKQSIESTFFPDTEESVRLNLSRIQNKKLIPRDYRYLKENIFDVNCAYFLASKLKLPFHCWADWAHYYDFKTRCETERIMQEKDVEGKIVTRLWQLMFPKLSLSKVSPDAFVKLLKSGTIADIRSFVETTHLTPEKITNEWYEEIKSNAASDRFAIKVFQLFTFCASCIAGFICDPALCVGIASGSFFSEKMFARLERSENRMGYTFQEAREIVGEHC